MNKKKTLLFVFFAILLIGLIEVSHEYTVINLVETDSENNQYIELKLNRGTYTTEFTISSEIINDSSWYLLDMNQNNGNNQMGLCVANGTLKGDTAEQKIMFQIEDDSDKLCLRISSPEIQIISEATTTLVDDEYIDNYVLIIVVVMLIILGRKFEWYNKKNVIILFIVNTILIMPYLQEGLLNGHDIYFHLGRLEGLADGLQRGQFPVRINGVVNNGFGSINPVCYPELFLYIPALLMNMGCSLIFAYKSLILLINVIATVVGYYSFSKLFQSKHLAMVACVLWISNPYRLTVIFLRAAIGEALAMAFFPLLLYGCYELFRGAYNKWPIVVVGATAIVQSHVISTEISAFFVLIAAIASVKFWHAEKDIKRFVSMFIAALCALFVNVWIIVPLLFQMDEIAIGVHNRILGASSIHPWQLFSLEVSQKGRNIFHGTTAEMPYSIGLVLLLGTIAYLYYLKSGVYKDEEKKITQFCLYSGLFSCYVATSLFPWNYIQRQEWSSMICAMQFPWRMCGYAAFFLTIVTAYAIIKLYEGRNNIILSLILGFTVLTTVNCVDSYMYYGEQCVGTRNQAINEVYNCDYYGLIFDNSILSEQNDTVVFSEAADITNYVRKGTDISFAYDLKEERETEVTFPIYNYGCYEVYINDKKIETATNDNCQLVVTVPANEKEGTVRLNYAPRKRYELSWWISTGSLFVIVLSYIIKRKRIIR